MHLVMLVKQSLSALDIKLPAGGHDTLILKHTHFYYGPRRSRTYTLEHEHGTQK